MSTGNSPRDEADFEEFLARQSPLSTAYDAIEPVQPPEVLDAKILAIARGAGSAAPAPAKPPAKAAAKAAPSGPSAGAPAAPKPAAASKPPPAAASSGARPSTVAVDDDDDDAPPARRPRWLIPAALAATVLVAVGVGVSLLDTGPANLAADSRESSRLGSLFAERARKRSEAEKVTAEAAAAAASEAEVELAPLPPPPFFEPEGPQVEDLGTAIALIRRELVLASQLAASAEEARTGELDLQGDALTAPARDAAGQVADAAPPTAPASAPAEAMGAAGVIQPRDRRLAKILELFDGGNPDLAAASLEIFLRDFEDDPISQRIIDAQPKATDVAVE